MLFISLCFFSFPPLPPYFHLPLQSFFTIFRHCVFHLKFYALKVLVRQSERGDGRGGVECGKGVGIWCLPVADLDSYGGGGAGLVGAQPDENGSRSISRLSPSSFSLSLPVSFSLPVCELV